LALLIDIKPFIQMIYILLVEWYKIIQPSSTYLL